MNYLIVEGINNIEGLRTTQFLHYVEAQQSYGPKSRLLYPVLI